VTYTTSCKYYNSTHL